MNEKFWNLKKEKQDRMLNAAMKVFAENGYANACTDVIVKEAGISKGLLFHYFVSKAGLYEFIVDYGIRYTRLEFSSLGEAGSEPFFRRVKSVAMVKSQIMKQYPYVFSFLAKASRDDKELIGEENAQKVIEYKSYLEGLYLGDIPLAELTTDSLRAYKLAMYIDAGAMDKDVCEGRKDGSLYYLEVMEMCDLLGR